MNAPAEPMIQLEALTKRYPNQSVPAVDALDLAIPRGEIVMLVGPSGCGKTTTLEMINRLIEPTSGRIILEGEDVTHGDVDQLRRRIGYAIQQIGLFPHRTIGRNVATVPRLLGWDKDRTRARVDELLTLVGLDPDEYRERYPNQLSGGQRQRVGVARAMAADPPVMLMDEPFGATDPITRNRLQREFLSIQQDIGKTIVFVTHDIDEAITLGDRIAILQEGAHIAQYATPEDILSAPSNDFVSDFLGGGVLFKRLNLARIGDITVDTTWPTVSADADADEARRATEAERPRVLVMDADRRPSRWVTSADLRDRTALETAGTPVAAVLRPDDSLADALQILLEGGGSSPVVDDEGSLRGVLDLVGLNDAITTMREQAVAAAADRSVAMSASRP
jgi:osmoprotectant transport system ATP-binding protein